MSTEFLRQIPIFSELSETDLETLCEACVPLPVKAGEVLVEEGSLPDFLWVIVDGEFEVTKRADKQDVLLSVRKAGELVGEMAVLEQVPRMATVRAMKDSHVLRIDQESFYRVLGASPHAVQTILHQVASRLRNIERLMVQNAKMAALGTLSAGLAHELNNPAAAAARSSDQLHDTLDRWQLWAGRLNALTFDPEQLKQLDVLRVELEKRAASPVILDSLDRSDQEEELQTWLEPQNIDHAWELAPPLVSMGWTPATLAGIAATFSPDQLTSVIPWLAYGGSAYSLLREVGTGTRRISEIVKAVKNYSYLDQGPVQQVDITRGLEDTLTILGHKLHQGINVTREYAPNLPRIEAYASDLNQVWTNIIDNAADAMEGTGELKLKAYAEDKNIVVEITDNGPGIAPDVQQHIFDPFFTTKPQGSGTGLGLHIAYNVVVDKHHGLIEAASKPGETTFKVTLPIQLARTGFPHSSSS